MGVKPFAFCYCTLYSNRCKFECCLSSHGSYGTVMASTRVTPDSSDESEPPSAAIPVITLSPYSPLKRRRVEPSDGFIMVHTIEDSSSKDGYDSQRSSKRPSTTVSSQMDRSFTARPEDSSFIESESDEMTQERALVCRAKLKVLPSSMRDSVPFIIFYEQHDLPVFSPDEFRVRELGMIYECNGSRFFQTPMDIGTVLLCLKDLETLDDYGNVSMPQQFQGSAMVTVRIRESQKEYVFNFLSTDGNGGWECKRSGPLRAFENGEERWYTRRYYTHSSTKIKKVIAYLVNEESSQELAGQCAIVRYCWSDSKGKPVTFEMFPVAKERRPYFQQFTFTQRNAALSVNDPRTRHESFRVRFSSSLPLSDDVKKSSTTFPYFDTNCWKYLKMAELAKAPALQVFI